MSNLLIGDQFQTPVNCPGYPRINYTNGQGWSYEEKFRIRTDLVKQFLPRDVESFEILPGTWGVWKVENISAIPEKGSPTSEVTVNWRPAPYNPIINQWNGDGNDANISYESSSSRAERRISEHPQWNLLTPAQQEALQARYPSFTLVSVQFTRRRRYRKSNYKFTEAGIIGSVNLIETPGGLKDATPGKWMNIGRQINWDKKSDYVEVVDQWQFDNYYWKGVLTPNSNLQLLLS